MLAHVLENARRLNPDRIVIVVGHGAERVQAAFAEQADLQFALQRPQQGTGHAVQQAVPFLLERHAAQDITLVLYGDVPLVQAETLQRLLDARAQGMAVLTETLPDPSGYGRIVRNAQGLVQRIVEHKDANPQEQAINEVNTGILAAPTAKLKNWLSRIDNKNAQGEYYLTDVVGLAVRDGVAVNAAQPGASWETLGVNSRAQQAQLERIWQGEQARRQLERGVTLADPARFDLRGSLTCGRDVFIDVGCVFEGSVDLAEGVRIGPHCVLKNARIGAGTHIDAFSHIQDAVVAANLLADRIRAGILDEGDLADVQRSRELPTRIIQGLQAQIQSRFLGQVLDATHAFRPPLVLSFPLMRRFLVRLLAFGPRQVHVEPRARKPVEDVLPGSA